ncbi:MAG: prenyltransferase/squalene oxidase repeat-containing protein [Kiritimatiellia bacterium]
MRFNEVDTNLAEIAEMYGNESYIKRMKKLFTGLNAPRDSRAYKVAMIEIQRLSAPISAILMPLLSVMLLIVLSNASVTDDRIIETQIIEAEEMQELTEIEVMEKPPEDMAQIDIDMPVDTPDVSVENVQDTPMSPQPQAFDTVMTVKSPVILKNIYGSTRNTGTRGASLARFGGDKETEDAVMRALRWLKKNQNDDGSWNKNKVAMTGLGVLTFLAHGEKPGDSPEFGETIRKALEFLLNSQQANGLLPGNYDHPIATYALCEAYGMTMNPNVKEASEKALYHIIKGQHPTGGWTYNLFPGPSAETGKYRDDTSYMGWCAQALKAGQLAKLNVDGLEKAMKLAIKGFQANAAPNGGFGYCGPGRGGLTAVGTLCMQLLGAANKSEVKESLKLMNEWVPTFSQYEPVQACIKQLKPEDLIKRDTSGKPVLDEKGKPEKLAPMAVAKSKLISTADPAEKMFYTASAQYYFYYATQCKFHEGGRQWNNWNKEMKPRYTKAQKVQKNGIKDHKGKDQDIGWWENADHASDRPVMDTCLAALQLMVYYRNLPTTSREAVQVEVEIQATSTDTGDIEVDVGNL